MACNSQSFGFNFNINWLKFDSKLFDTIDEQKHFLISKHGYSLQITTSGKLFEHSVTHENIQGSLLSFFFIGTPPYELEVLITERKFSEFHFFSETTNPLFFSPQVAFSGKSSQAYWLTYPKVGSICILSFHE